MDKRIEEIEARIETCSMYSGDDICPTCGARGTDWRWLLTHISKQAALLNEARAALEKSHGLIYEFTDNKHIKFLEELQDIIYKLKEAE